MDIGLRNDETIIVEDECLMHKTLIAYHGLIKLTNQRIIFKPTSSIEKLAGAKDISIELHKIKSAKIEGVNQFLKIMTEDKNLFFSGQGANRIHERLDIQLRAMTGEQLNIADLDTLNEKVLLQGDVEVYLNAGFQTKGQIILTMHRIRIESFSSMKTMFFSHKTINSSFTSSGLEK